MWRVFLVVSLLGFVACTNQPTMSIPQPPTAVGVVTLPTSNLASTAVVKAIEAMTIKDEVGLTEQFDPELAQLRNTLAFQAINRWTMLQDPAHVPVYGKVKTYTIADPELSGQTTVVRVAVQHEQGTSQWEFQLRQTATGWHLHTIRGQGDE
jgi:hypothetical protein